MKKVLIGLLVLAVAGGSAFAQEWQFNGEMRAGLGVFFFEDDDDPFVRPVSEATNGMRTDLRTRVANADGTAGLDFLFRAQGAGAAGPVNLEHGFGWLNFMDNMLTLQGGRIDDAAGFNSFDRMTGTRMGEGTGLRLLVRPMDGLVLNFGAYANPGRNLGLFEPIDHTPASAGPPPVAESGGQARGVFAFSYTRPDVFRMVGGLRSTGEAGAPAQGYDGFGAHNPVRDYGGTRASAAYFSFEFLGLAGDGIHLAASAFFMNLEEFSDEGCMRFFATFGHSGLVENMNLTLGASIGLHQRDSSDMHLWFWGAVDYQLTDAVVPRLDVHYVMGGRGTGDTFNMNHRDVARGGATFNGDHSFLRIQPSVQFRVQPNTFLELGAIFCVNLGEDDVPNASTAWASGHGTNMAAYALMRVSF